MDKEIEFKWQAHSLRDYKLFLQLAQNCGAKLSKPKKVQNKDQYLDTPENFFQSCRLECRIRLSDGHSELTLKSFSDPKKGIFIREEKNIQLPYFTSKKTALTYCRNKFFRNIQPLFDILNNRQIHAITLPCGTCAEASFDQVLMSCGKKKHRMKEIELEFKSGELENFKEFISQLKPLSLTPSKASKFEEGMKHLKENSGFSSIDTLHELHETASKVLEINVEKLKKNQSFFVGSLQKAKNGVVSDTPPNPETVHDMRVATRRLRAAIKIFKGILPSKAKKIRNKLEKMGCILGQKRDLDVFSEFIGYTINGKSASLQKLALQIEQSQEKILSMLKSKYYARLLKSIEKLEAGTTKQNIFKVSRELIRKKLRKILEIAAPIDSEIDDKTLHKLRISIKNLRYICEFFEPLFSKYICSLGPFIEKTIAIQDLLGEHQDAIKGMSMLKRYKNKFTQEEILLIKRKYELKKMRTRKSFLTLWKDYWVGTGFNRASPSTAIELIL